MDSRLVSKVTQNISYIAIISKIYTCSSSDRQVTENRVYIWRKGVSITVV